MIDKIEIINNNGWFTGIPKFNVQKLKATTYRSDDFLIAVLA